MSIADEIKEAAVELAFSFSQDQWEKALVDGWKADASMASVLSRAAGIGRRIKNAEWDQLRNRASELKPAMSVHSMLNQPCRAWIASHATKSNDYFWAGYFDKAKSLLKLGGCRARAGVSVRREARKAEKEIAGLMVIKVRERDKRTDWKVCK
jgi:hypothetical protein